MWNQFGSQPAAASPEQLDSIDVIAARYDGGLDLGILASQPLDDSPETLERIRNKVATYLETIELDAFQSEMGHPPRSQTTIIFYCEHPIHPAALAVLDECQAAAAQRGIQLVLETTPIE